MKKLLSVLTIILLTAVVSIFGTLFVLGMVDNEADMKASDNTEVIDSAKGEGEEILSDKAEIEEKEPLTTPDVESETKPEIETEVSTPEVEENEEEQSVEKEESAEPQPEESDKGKETEEIPDIIKLPEHIRPEGYDNPVLTEEVALEIMREARDMQLRILFGGVNEDGLDYWYHNGKHIFVHIKPYTYDGIDDFGYDITYYVPGLDTFERFYDYFLKVFTEETIVRAVNEYDIAEYNGELAGELPINYKGYYLETDWSRTELVELKQDTENGTASVTIRVYYDTLPDATELNPNNAVKEYNLVYSEKYGWRVELESIDDIV